MTMLRGNYAAALAPGFRKVVFESYKERPVEGNKLVNRQSANRAYIEDFPVAGFGTLQPKVEGGPVIYQDPASGVAKRYTMSTFALGFRVTEEMIQDDLAGITGAKLSRALGRSARNNEEIVIASIFNNAFSTSFAGFTAAEALLGAHVGLRGASQRNRPATDVDFSLPALQAALEHFHNLTDESGIPMVRSPKMVVHSVGDYWAVNQVLKSQFLPGGSQNDINQIAQEGITGHLSHYMTDADAWFVVSDETDLNVFDRMPFRVSTSEEFETGDVRTKGVRRIGAGFGDWRGIYGSSGA